ncbi:hypothetical protein BY996DRAFT_6420077 [Phakopsora pachyrhizi]|nr:hypothetical protein BY996DRAFT_6420077 [Phakopsora pachyrhizi]
MPDLTVEKLSSDKSKNEYSRPNSLIDHLQASLICSTWQVPDPLLDQLKTCKSQLEAYGDQLSLGSEVVARLKVFNVQAESLVHARALNNSKRFQSLEAVDKDFTPTRKGSQLDESTSSNF